MSRTSTSITSSVFKYEWKNGRRYHSYQSENYAFPNDDKEQDRLDMVHHAFYRLLNDKLFLAPIDTDKSLEVLDIGCGTGLRAIEMGDKYPSCNILGNDLSPIQPSWVPPNVRFVVDDVELPWADPTKYDYIHCRYMAGSIKDWPGVIAQTFAISSPDAG